jgi:molybdate transport system substrate-binding protein
MAVRRGFIAFITSTILMSGAANAAEIRVIGSPGFREAYNLLVPQFEKATGHHVRTVWDGVNNVATRVAAGETAEIVILPVAQIEELTQKGKLASGSRVDVAKSGIGVAVKAGAPKPDLSSGEALKNALLKAKSIAYSTGPSGVHMAHLLQQWGIAEAVKARIVIAPSDTPVGEIVARGDAEIGFQQVSELIRIKGIDYLGPLPGDVQEVTVFAAALHTSAATPDAAKALVKFLSVPAAAATIRKTGMEPG